MKDIIVKFIDGKDQRYPTAGDYWEDDDSIQFRITKQKDDDADALVLLHELIEFVLTKKRGIHESRITAYDLDWEARVHKGDEPGNEHDCIYKKEHRFSENLERQFAHELGVDWFEYNDNIKL